MGGCFIMANRKIQDPDSRISEPQVSVPRKDAEMIRKIHRILRAGKNVEIKLDSLGTPKVFRVSREIA